MKSSLSPCPFCGAAGYISHSPATRQSRIRCSECKAGTNWKASDHLEETYRRWNRRAHLTPDLEGLVKKLFAAKMPPDIGLDKVNAGLEIAVDIVLAHFGEKP